MTWPFPKPDNKPADPQVGDGHGAPETPKEKTPAELIAESLQPLAATLKTVADGQAALTGRLDAIESQTRRPEPKPQPGEPVSVLDDENVAFAQRIGPVMLRQLELEARVVKSEIRNEYVAKGFGDLWREYEKDIDAVVDASPLADGQGKPLRGSPQYIRNCVDMIFGRAAVKGGVKFDSNKKSFFLETGSTGETNSNATPETDGLTADQRRVFDRLKVPSDRAKFVMSKLKFVS